MPVLAEAAGSSRIASRSTARRQCLGMLMELGRGRGTVGAARIEVTEDGDQPLVSHRPDLEEDRSGVLAGPAIDREIDRQASPILGVRRDVPAGNGTVETGEPNALDQFQDFGVDLLSAEAAAFVLGDDLLEELRGEVRPIVIRRTARPAAVVGAAIRSLIRFVALGVVVTHIRGFLPSRRPNISIS